MGLTIGTIKFYTTLQIDVMYYHAAQQNYATARNYETSINKANADYVALLEDWRILKEGINEGEDATDVYPEQEALAFAMDNQEYEIGRAHGPFLQCLAAVHILCAASLEAFINDKAKDALPGKLFDNFDKVSLEGKWLFLPRLMNKSSYDPATQPFQGFVELIKYRNGLVHYKSKREEVASPSEIPEFINKLGLSLAAANNSLNTVKGMIDEYYRQQGETQPKWLDAQDTNYFQVKVEFE